MLSTCDPHVNFVWCNRPTIRSIWFFNRKLVFFHLTGRQGNNNIGQPPIRRHSPVFVKAPVAGFIAFTRNPFNHDRHGLIWFLFLIHYSSFTIHHSLFKFYFLFFRAFCAFVTLNGYAHCNTHTHTQTFLHGRFDHHWLHSRTLK